MPTPERLNPTSFPIRFSTFTFRLAGIFTASFIVLILSGTGLLMLPGISRQAEGISFLNALFTATSAATLTGLTVVNVAASFTFTGQLVLLLLIQLGGIGIMAFATIAAAFLRNNLRINHQSYSFISSDVWPLLKRIIWLVLFIEAIGCVGIFITWGNEVHFESLSQKLFYSLFHAVSAFCNAGFSLFPQGFHGLPLSNAYILQIVIASMVILGGLGFSPILDVFSPATLRERLADPSKDWKLSSKIAIYMSIVLIIAGIAGFYLLEKNNTLAGLNLTEAMITSFFQSAATRTAGFSNVDTSQLLVSTLTIMLLLMFIGASPGSTGGGIKTTTFFLLVVAIIYTIGGKKLFQINKRTFSSQILFKAILIVVFASLYCLLAFIMLCITEPGQKGIDLLFEQISAFSNAGLSTGITFNLSSAGKIILLFSMFVGRLGILILIWWLLSTRNNDNIHSQDESTLLG